PPQSIEGLLCRKAADVNTKSSQGRADDRAQERCDHKKKDVLRSIHRSMELEPSQKATSSYCLKCVANGDCGSHRQRDRSEVVGKECPNQYSWPNSVAE